jgi:putative phosphoesterase
MLVAIISDIHDNIPMLRSALERVGHADVLVCCGDLCSPFVIKEMAQGFEGDIHVVFGNNDGDRFRIYAGAQKYPQVTIHGEFCELDLGGKRFAVNHFDNIGRTMVDSGSYDVVCFGHNHRFEIDRSGGTLVINPGEIYGLLTGKSTCVVYDTEAGEATRIDIAG